METEMSKIITFERPVSIDERIFRNKIWTNFEDAIKKKEDLLFDFQNVTFIESTVVTKICCLGEIAKRESINIEIIPSVKLALYLAEMDFWQIASMNEIFDFDINYLEMNFSNKKVTNALFCIQKEELKRKYWDKFEFAEWVKEETKYKFFVMAELAGINNAVGNGTYTLDNIPDSCKAVLKTISGFAGYSSYASEDAILGPIVEIVHNAVWHGEGKCYFLAQTSSYKGKHNRVGIDISVADTGCGLYKSLSKKKEGTLWYYSKEDFIKIVDKSRQNYYSIIEALFFRQRSAKRGLYDIITDLANEPKDYFSEIHLINGNVAFDLRQGQKINMNDEIIKAFDISNFLNKGIENMIKKQDKYFAIMPDIGFSVCVDITISVPAR